MGHGFWIVLGMAMGIALSVLTFLELQFTTKWYFHLGGLAAFVLIVGQVGKSASWGSGGLDFGAAFGVVLPIVIVAACFGYFFAGMITSTLFKFVGALLSTAGIKLRRGFSQAEAAEKRGDYETAAQLYHVAIEEEPTDLEPRQRLAELYAKMQRFEEAVETLRKAAELTDDVESKFLLTFRIAEILADDLADPQAALIELESLAAEHPEAPACRYARTRIANLRRRVSPESSEGRGNS